MHFKEKLKHLVDEAGGNKKKLSEDAGLWPSAISNFLKRKSPTLSSAYALARLFKVDLNWLGDDAADMPAEASGAGSYRELVDPEEMKRFQEFAARKGGMDVCLAAAVAMFMAAPEQDRAYPIMKARDTKDAADAAAVPQSFGGAHAPLAAGRELLKKNGRQQTRQGRATRRQESKGR